MDSWLHNPYPPFPSETSFVTEPVGLFPPYSLSHESRKIYPIYPFHWGCFKPVLIAGFTKDIEYSDHISTCYLSEIDEDLVSTLNLCPPFAIGVFVVLRLSGALVVHHPNIVKSMLYGTADALVVHGCIFSFACDNIQPITLDEFVYWFITAEQLNTIFPA